MLPGPSLETDRLLLRPFRLSDADDVRKLAGAKQIAENTGTIPHPYEEGMAEEWISTHADQRQEGLAIHFAVCLKVAMQLIGALGVVIHKEHHRGELGYWIGVPFWNNGYCTEAARAVIRFGFENLGLNRIHAIHFTRNPASGRVMEKIGMSFEGIHRQHMRRWGKFVDVASYGLLRDEYPKTVG